MQKYNFDKVVFEGNLPEKSLNIFREKYGRENLYLHLHSQYKDKSNISKYIGNLIGVSNFILNDWDNYFKESGEIVTTNHLLVNCVRHKKFAKSITDEERKEVRNSLGYTDDDFVVIFCGRILKIKGIEELMTAIVGINEPNIKLLCIGSPNFSTQFITLLINPDYTF